MTAGTNYVTNPSFTAGVAGYTGTGCSIAQDTTHAAAGGPQFCAVITPSATVAYVTYSCAGLTVGKRYTASVYYYVPSTSGNSVLVQAGAVAGWDSRGGLNNWGRVRVSFTALTTTVAILIGSVNAVSGQPFYIDKVMVNDGDLAYPYFDGDYPYSSWTGTVGASTSTNTVMTQFSNLQTEEIFLAGALCLNTVAWNIKTKTGRFTIPGVRGTNTKVPGASGASFIKNKPVDTGLLTLTMWVLGSNADGTIPFIGEGRRVFERNVAQLMQAVSKTHEPVTLTSWQADGTVRQTNGTLGGQTDGALMAGGMRAEFTMIFEILNGSWSDFSTATMVGTAGAGWSNQNLTLTPLAGGTAPIEDAVVTVHGPIANPVVSNPLTGVSVTLNGTLGTTDVWVIDSGQFTSTLNGVSNITSITHAGHPRFVLIPAGELLAPPVLNLSGTGTGTNTNLSVTAHRKHWSS